MDLGEVQENLVFLVKFVVPEEGEGEGEEDDDDEDDKEVEKDEEEEDEEEDDDEDEMMKKSRKEEEGKEEEKRRRRKKKQILLSLYKRNACQSRFYRYHHLSFLSKIPCKNAAEIPQQNSQTHL